MLVPTLCIAQTTVLERQEPPPLGDSIRPQVFGDLRYDSNLFRLADGVQPGGDGQRSVWTRSIGAGLSVDKRYALQHLLVDAAAVRDTYSRYGNLDFTGYRVTSQLDWSVTPELAGTAYFNRIRLPTSFEYVGYRTAPTPRTSKRTRLEADFKPGAAIHPRVALYSYEDTSSVDLFQLESSRSRGGEASLVYEFRSGNEVSLYGRRAHGEGTQSATDLALLVSPTFRENEFGARIVLRGADRSRADLVIGQLQRKNDDFGVRDFHGWVGRLRAIYPITGKTAFQLYAGRLYGASPSAISTYYTLDEIQPELVWFATGKIKVTAGYRLTHQVFRGSPFPVASEIRQTLREKTIAVDWSPVQALEVMLRLSDADRTATADSLQFVDRSASVLVRFTF